MLIIGGANSSALLQTSYSDESTQVMLLIQHQHFLRLLEFLLQIFRTVEVWRRQVEDQMD